MTSEPSPWASPETEFTVPVIAPAGGPDSAGEPGHSAPTHRPGTGNRPGGDYRAQGDYRAGGVTRLRVPPASSPTPVEPHLDPAAADRKTMRRYLAVAAAIAAIGLVVVIGIIATGNGPSGGGLLAKTLSGPRDTRGDLAKLCPPPSDSPERQRREIPPPPPGPRTVDTNAGISYAAYGDPWRTWDQVWSGGDLKVTYRVGQHFVTEPGPDGTGYHASILSGSVPATVNDALALDLKCTGQQVAADVRTEYYFQPNTVEKLRDEFATIGGLSAWVSVFRLHFNHAGLKAKDELAAVVLFDVGRPEAAILYVSIPGTHHEWDHAVNEVIDSVRPT